MQSVYHVYIAAIQHVFDADAATTCPEVAALRRFLTVEQALHSAEPIFN